LAACNGQGPRAALTPACLRAPHHGSRPGTARAFRLRVRVPAGQRECDRALPYPSSTHPHRATQAPEVLLLGGGGEAGTAYYVVDAHAGRLALQGRLDMHVAQVRAHLPMRRMGLALLVSGGADAPVVAGRGAASAAAQTPRAEQRADLPLGPARVCLSPAYPRRSWSCRRRCMRAARSSAQTCCFAPLGFVLALRTLAGHGAAGAAARAPRGAARVPAAQPH
jgi:hypothetical protein